MHVFVCLYFSIGGLILDKAVSDPNLAGIIVYAPVINGESPSFGRAYWPELEYVRSGDLFPFLPEVTC